jgi:ATP-dependent RNA helicase RhlB
MKFTELNLPAEVLIGVEAAGFTDLTPVQEESIPFALDGKDVAAQAQTGTGKTAAFLIALFTRFLRHPKKTGCNPRALILAPTRELVVQIVADAKILGSGCPFKVQAIYGGMDYDKQRQALKDGVDVIVATPGRLIDYAKQKVFSFDSVEMVVIDEADRMFDLGFIKDLRYLLRKLPTLENRQTMLFSATLSPRVMELAWEFMDLPEKIRIEPEQVTAERVEQVLYHVSRREKFPLLLGLISKDPTITRAMVFVNTKREAEYLTDCFCANNFNAAVISGDIPQNKRMRILSEFKEGKLTFLVATDVASRGLHVDAVTHVFNYDLPQDAEDYVHRIGRTARAGAAGKAISFADEDLVFHLPEIEEYIGQKIPSSIPEDGDFRWDYHKPKVQRRSPLRPGSGVSAGKDKGRPPRPGNSTSAPGRNRPRGKKP